jgi:hypothetical protein
LSIVDPDIHSGQEFFCGMTVPIHAGSSPVMRLIFKNKVNLFFGRLPTEWLRFRARSVFYTHESMLPKAEEK